MPLSDYPKIEKIIESGYNFKFGSYIDEGSKLFQKQLWYFVGFTLIFLVGSGLIGSLPIAGQIANTFLGPILVVGFYYVANKVQLDREVRFDDFFKGFNFASNLILRVIAVTAILLIAALPFIYFSWDTGLVQWYMELVQNPNDSQELMEDFPGFSWYSLFLLLPAVYLGIAYSWADMFIVFKGMNFWDAMEASRQIISQKWFTFFGFSFVLGLIMMLGVLAVCIGLIFSLPAIMCMNYIAFAHVTGLNDDPEEEDIMEHLIE